MSKKREYSIPPITYTHVAPENVYNGQYDIPLAESFSENRYSYDPDLRTFSIVNDKYGTNAGAVQLFNKDNNDSITKPFSNLSKPYPVDDKKTSFGHSERLGMRDLLNSFIPENTGEIERPSYYARTPDERNQPLNILRQLMLNRSQYKDYLTNQNAIVKMWSERPPCSSNFASDPSGNCREFMNTISPDGSKYMYIVNSSYNERAGDVQKASKALAEAYKEHKRNPLTYTRNVNDYKRQRTIPPTQESTHENVSPTTQAFIDELWGNQNKTPSPKKETLDGLTMEEWLEMLENQD